MNNAFALAAIALAAVAIDSAEAAPPASPTDSGSQLNIAFESTKGSGKDMPLYQAVSVIVPRGFTVQTKDVDRWLDEPVSWEGGRDWTSVLRDALAPYPNLVAEVSLSARTVTLRPRQVAVAGGVVAGANASVQWTINVGDRSLKNVFARWAEAAGWQLSWELQVDYTIQTRAALTGRFEDVVEAVVKSMEQSEVPMKAVFYGANKVLRIVAKGAQ
jgi:hypothetical protein